MSNAWAAVGLAVALREWESERNRDGHLDYLARDVQAMRREVHAERLLGRAIQHDKDTRLEERLDSLEQAVLVLAAEVQRLGDADGDLWAGIQRLSRIANGKETSR